MPAATPGLLPEASPAATALSPRRYEICCKMAKSSRAPATRFYRDISRRFGQTDSGLPSALTVVQRQLLLLTSLEEVNVETAAPLLCMDADEALGQLNRARDRLRSAAATDVLIIEDEPIIAMDIEELVASCGHRVVGVAATETDAVAMAEKNRPGLILADINLGQGGDGTSAVSRIMRNHYAPVIFVTAYPERLLTRGGSRARFRHHQAF